MRKLKNLIIILILFFIVVLTYKVIHFQNFKSRLEKDISLYKKQYSIFSRNYFLSQPKKEVDIIFMFKWSKIALKNEKYELLNSNNVFFKYDSLSKKSLVYFAYKYNEKAKIESEVNFYNFLLCKPYKIEITSINPTSFDCDKVSHKQKVPIQGLLQNFELFKKEKSLLSVNSDRKLFYKQLKTFEKTYNKEILNPNILNTLWFVYEKGKIEVICSDNFSNFRAHGIALKLEKYFSEIDTEYFDYSLFALRLFESDSSR
jgi:hypothetical protein